MILIFDFDFTSPLKDKGKKNQLFTKETTKSGMAAHALGR